MKKLLNSFRYAVEGIIYCLKTQRNMRIHFTAAIFVILAGLLLKLEIVEIMILCIVISLVIICEMINTAIEKAIDLSMKDFNPLAKISKDVAAGAVLISAVTSVIIGVLLFLNYII